MSQKRHPEENEGSRAVGSGGPAESDGSPSPTHRRGEPKRQRVPALREVISEVMRKTSIEKFFLAIEPLIRRVVKEEIESAFANHVTMMRRSVMDIVPSTSKNLQLQFMTKLSLPIFTGSKIEGEGSLTITIALVDALTREVVASGQESLMKVEILVLEGDFEGGEGDDWTAQEFNNNIVREREGKRPLLSGDVFVGLIKGIGTVGELSFTDNSSWTRSRKFRLGARTEDGCFNGVRVREAKTESFVVKDHRGQSYKKHHPPVLEDEVWRLEKIGKEGAFHKRLNRERIVSVKDFLTLLHLDAPRLRKILGSVMSTKMWEVTVEHAKTCILTAKVHLYYPDNLSKTAVVFNVVGEVRGLISEKFVSVDDLTEKEKAEAHAAVKQAYENWKNVMTCDNETLLESPSQLFNMRSPSLHENGYNQFPTQVATDGFGLSHSDIPSADMFSIVPWSALDPCALETAESNENRFQWELPPLGGHGPPQELQALDKSFNSLVYVECTSHPSFSEDYYRCADPTVHPSFDQMTRDLILDQLVENIFSDLQLEDERGLISPIGLGPMKLVEQKKRKASATYFAPARFKLKIKKTTRSSGIPIDSDQSTLQEKTLEEKVEPAPEQVAVPVPAQEPVVTPTPHAEVVVPTPPAEVVVPEEFQQVPTPAENSSRRVVFPHRFRIFEDEDLNEAWGRISDYQAKTSLDSIFAEYNNMAIQHTVENFAVVGELTQRIKLLEKKNFELEKEVMAKEAIIAKLKEEYQNKDRSIEYLTTRHKEVLETIEKKCEEQTQALKRTEKALELERGKEAAFGQNLEEKVKAFNKMLFDMGSEMQLPNLGDPTEKINYLGRQLEDLRSVIKTTRENHTQTMFEAVKNGVSFALAKLKVSDSSINLQVVEEDFNCSVEEATKVLEEMAPLGHKVAEEMEVGSPTRSNQSGGSEK